MCFPKKREQKRTEVINCRLVIIHKYCDKGERYFFLTMSQIQGIVSMQKLIKFNNIDSEIISVRATFQSVK